jgi:hypothetical protein
VNLRARVVKCGIGSALLLSGARAQAYETQVDASFAAQYYSLQSPYGSPLVARRRYTQTLSLNVYDIQGDRTDRGPLLSFKSRVRLDADFGQRPEERDPSSSSFVPGLAQAPFDVMYAYIEGERYLRGMLGFRLGRQYVIDSLGFWSFDGADVELTLPAYFAIEGYAGFEQRGGLPMLATSRFEGDGVSRGQRSGLAFDQSPAYLEESKLAPAFGAAIETAGLHYLHSRLTYRKVINRDTVLVSPFSDLSTSGAALDFVHGDRTSSERAGYSLRASDASLGSVSGAVVYDLYNQAFASYDLGLDWYATEHVTLGGTLGYFKPMFDADSIFNWFVHDGTTSASGRADVQLTRDAEVVANGGVRMYTTEGVARSYATTATPNLNDTGRSYDTFGGLGGRYRFGVGSVALNSMAESGTVGHRYGGDVTTRRLFDGGYYDSLLVLSLYDWRDALRPDRSATSFSYVLGGGISPAFLGSHGRVGVEWEHTMNRLVGERYRLLATVDFTVLK